MATHNTRVNQNFNDLLKKLYWTIIVLFIMGIIMFIGASYHWHPIINYAAVFTFSGNIGLAINTINQIKQITRTL